MMTLFSFHRSIRTRRVSIAALVSRGYTLLELGVSIGIFAVITAVVIFNYADFNNNLVMTNQAYEISLGIRQAQIYGLSVRGREDDYDSSYAIHFDRGLTRPFIFADVVEDGVYRASGDLTTDEILDTIELFRGTTVSDICVAGEVTDGVFSSGTEETCGFDTLDIAFKRPDPDARIRTGFGGTSDEDHLYSYARIIISAPNGRRREIIARVTGQVSVVIPSDDAVTTNEE